MVAGRPFLAWLAREFSRYGIDEVLLLGPALERLTAALPTIMEALPKKVRLAYAVPHALHPHLLLGDGLCLADVQLASAFADPPYPSLRAPSGQGGLALVEREAVLGALAAPGGFAEALPALLSGSCAAAAPGWWAEIATPSGLARAQAELLTRLRRRALFLDRDGTLNRDHGYVGSRARWEWMPGAIAAVTRATAAGWHVFVVTNQSGIARGYYGERDVEDLHGWMVDALRAAGGTVDDIRLCPYHPEAAVPLYRRVSDWRKPAPGMILDLLARWEVDPAGCVLVGDQPSDMEAARAAGIRGVPFTGGDLDAVVAPLLGPAC